MIAWFCLALSAAPLLLAIDNLRRLRAPAPAQGTPSISVLIPARNEADNIAAAAACVLASTGIILELLVLDDGSTDATAQILAGIADPRLRVLLGGGLPNGWSGKQHACARLAESATYDLLLFVDADVRLAPDAANRIAGFMQRNDIGLASGFPRQITRGFAEFLLLPLIHFLLLGYLPMARMQRDVSPGFGAGCGQLMIARREAYVRAGGHAAIGASMHDGLMLPRAFRRAGIMTGLFDATDLATCRMYDSAANRATLAQRGSANGIMRKGGYHRPVADHEQIRNKRKGRRRRNIERIFGHWKRCQGYRIVRYLGLVKNQLELTLKAVTYNLRRLVTLATA